MLKSSIKSCLALAGLCLCIYTNAEGAVLYFLGEHDQLVGIRAESAHDPVTAIAALATPAWDGAQILSSAIPAGTDVLGVYGDGQTVTVEFGQKILGQGLDDQRLENIFAQVRATLHPFGLGESIRLQTGGRLLSDYLPPTPVIEAAEPGTAPIMAPAIGAAADTGALAGKKISLSPGHGSRWNGSSWAFERPVYCAPLNCEDDHNLEIMTYLDVYLRQDGAVTKVYRCLDKNYGMYNAQLPWWRVSAGYWLKQNGYPCSVYSSLSGECTLGNGASDSNDSLRSRGLAANYDNTDIYVSLHSNGNAGDCNGTGCANGTCTYYDAGSSEHAAWGAISRTLAQKVNTAIVDVIRTRWNDTTWRNRGSIDANGSQAETRIPTRAAILIELAFHDTCDRDALALRDNFFRSATMWASYKGICDYFGVAPTWGFYSCEIVSDTIPPMMPPGSSASVQVTMRNRGVLWNDARQFRLGAVGNSDPFTATIRHNVGMEVNPGGTRTFTFTIKAPSTPGIYTTDWQMLREGVAWFGPVLSKPILVSATPDTEPPTAPANLVATPVSTTQVDLRWKAASDNLGIGNYNIYRDAALLGTSGTTNYSDTTCASRTTYTYRVSGVDYSGNESPFSAEAQVTTPAQLDFIMDNPQGVPTGVWTTGTSSSDKYGGDYRFITVAASTTGTFRWTPPIEQAGYYNIYVWYPAGSNRCTNAPYTIQYAGGSVTIPVNQTVSGGQWRSLGSPRPFITGTSGYVQLGNASMDASKVVLADAVRLTYQSPLPALSSVQVSPQGNFVAITWQNSMCVLQECVSLTSGVWSDVTNAPNPYVVSPGPASQRFYRLRY